MDMDSDSDSGYAGVRYERKIRPTGNSLSISIPPAVLRAVGLEEGDDTEVVAKADGAVVIRPVKDDEQPRDEIEA
jgi:antitoxin component of MazEF toxin-antitoxin module